MQYKEDDLKGSILCMKSFFSYAAKLLNLILKDTNEASLPPSEIFGLANDMLDLVVSVELYLGSSLAARIASAAKPWPPDLILALGSGSILEQASAENTYLTTLSRVKLHYPSWPSVLAKIELCEISKASSDEEDTVLEAEEFPVLKNVVELIVSLLKGSRNVLDAVGIMFLAHQVLAWKGRIADWFWKSYALSA